MRILHILDHSIPLHSGYTFRSRAILERQRALGWETFHITSIKHKKPKALEETVDGLHFYRTPQPRGLMVHLPLLGQWSVVTSLERRLADIIPRIKPDVIHAHSPALNGLAAVRVGQRFNIPVVYEIRAFWEDAAVDHGTAKEWGFRYRLTRALETHVVRRADAVTTICEGLRGDLIDRGVPQSKITVIPNAVDAGKFQFGGARDTTLADHLGLTDKHVLGFIGSFYAYEGLSLLLEAMPDICQVLPDTCLMLVGGGPQDENLKQQVLQLGLQDKVLFVGRIPHDQVQAYYNLVDIFVYPRLPMRLTNLVTPLKPLEAMAQGSLIVASDVGGHKELIQDGITGRLFKAGDKESLAQTVIAFLNDSASWAAYRQAGRRYVEAERNWSVSVSRYAPVYEQLCALRGGS
ncbi:MAG: glycosyltransferase, exosortase A system-associated [Gammaproteobacteria bacterium]|nr:glycosyltransferase, exosortase A system-associated [Gammaproteobacteria bacterium]